MSGPGDSNGIELFGWLPSRQADPTIEAGPPRGVRQLIDRDHVRDALWLYEAEAEATVSALHRGAGLSVHPVVPNMAAYVRDAADRGPIGAVLGRFKRLSLADRAQPFLHHLGRAPGVLAKDFTTGILIPLEMEAVKF